MKPDQTQKSSRETLVILLLVLSLLAGAGGILAWSAEKTLFNPQAYKVALEEQGAYHRFPVLLQESLAQGGERLFPGAGQALLGVMQAASLSDLSDALFPEPWVRAQTESLVDQFWAYFNFQTDEFHLLVDLLPIRDRLAGSQSPQIASIILQGLPPCTGQELFNFGLGLLTGQSSGLPLCRPPEQFTQLADSLVAEMLQASAAAMPEQIDLASGLRLTAALSGDRANAAWQRVYGLYRLLREIGPWLPWLFLVLLLLTLGAARGTLRGPVYWGGAALLTTGVFVAVTALLTGLLAEPASETVVLRLFGSGFALADLLGGVVEQVARAFVTRSLFAGLAVALIGSLLVVLAVGRSRPPISQ